MKEETEFLLSLVKVLVMLQQVASKVRPGSAWVEDKISTIISSIQDRIRVVESEPPKGMWKFVPNKQGLHPMLAAMEVWDGDDLLAVFYQHTHGLHLVGKYFPSDPMKAISVTTSPTIDFVRLLTGAPPSIIIDIRPNNAPPTQPEER